MAETDTRKPLGALAVELEHPSSTKVLVRTGLVTLALLALANVGAWAYLRSSPANQGYAIIEAKWELLRAEQEPVEWLVLGDSSCNQGVDPKALESALGGRALNACTIGDMLAIEDAWMLDEYIQRHGAPKNVIIVHVYDIWHRDDTVLKGLLWNIDSDPERWRKSQPSISLSWREGVFTRVAPWLPLYSQSASLQALIWQPRRLFAQREIGLSPLGFMSEAQARPEVVERDARAHLKFVQSNKPLLSEPNAEALKHLSALASAHKINVYLVPSPLYEGLWRQDDFRRYYEQTQALIAQQLDSKGRLWSLGSRPMMAAADELQNVDHVTAPAASRYTQQLAASIKAASPHLSKPPEPKSTHP